MLNRLAVLLALVLGVVCLVLPEQQEQQLDILTILQDEADVTSSRVQRQTLSPAKKLEVLQSLWQLIFGTARDTRRAFANITDTVQMNLIPDLLDEMPLPPAPPTTPADPTASTTEPPYRLTRQELLGLIRKNLYGLVRLFNREYRLAINDSRVNAVKADKDLLNALRTYFK